MSTLAEIETAADSLSTDEKEELLCFLASRLGKERLQTVPRIYSIEEISAMFAEDEVARESLRREIQIGLDEIQRGEVAPLDMAEIKQKAHSKFEAEHRN